MNNNFFKKNKKLIIISLPLFFIFTIIYMAIFNLNTLVSLGFKAFTYGTIKIENIKIEKGSTFNSGLIKLEESKLYYKKELISDAPKVILKYKNFKIEEINIYKPKVKLIRNNTDINFVNIFTGENNNPNTNKKQDPIIKNINIYNANLDFIDRSYSQEISKKIKNLSGYINFKNNYNVILNFNGNNEKEKYNLSFETKDEFFEFKIKGKNIKATSELIQYGYDSNSKLTHAKGIIDIDLKINSNGFFGKGNLLNGEILYEDLGVPVKNLNLNLNFLGEKILINGEYFLLKNKGIFKVDYDKKKGTQVDFIFKNIPYKHLSNYKYLKNQSLDFDNFIFNNLNMKILVKKNFKILVDFNSIKGFKKNELTVDSLKGQFIYEDSGMKINNLQGNIKYSKAGKSIERKILANVFYAGNNGKIDVNLKSNNDDFPPNINLGLLFKTKKDGLEFKINSNILKLNAEYNYDKNSIFLSQKNNFKLNYDLTKKEITKLSGYIQLKFDKYNTRTIFHLKSKNNIELNSKIVYLNKKRSIGNINANIDFNKLIYNLKLNIKSFPLIYKNMEFLTSINGYIKGNKKNLDGELIIEDTSFKIPNNKFEVNNILGTLFLEKKENFSIIYQGEIGKIIYDKNEINGFKTSIKLSDNNLEILDLSNKFLTLNGNYSIIKENLNLNIDAFNINKDIFNINNLEYQIKEINGQILGNLNDLKGNFKIKNGQINFPKNINISFKGDLNYFKNKIYSEHFLINKNDLSFSYNLNDKKGNYQVSIFEDVLSQYTKNLKFNIIGKSFGTIDNNNIKGNFNGNIEEVYYKGNKLPDINIISSYTNDEINFKEISILSLKNKNNTLTIKGYINIKEKLLEFDLFKQKVFIKDFINDKKSSGEITIAGKAKGDFKKINYSLEATNGKIGYNNINAKNLNFNISGDNNNLNLSNFNLNYHGNDITANGIYNIKDNKYNFNLNSQDIDLKFLLAFLEPLGINDISGKGKIDLNFTDIVPDGKINITNFDLISKKYGLNFKNFNGNFYFKNGFLKINNLFGKLNKGSLNLEGYLEIKKAIENFFKENFTEANYSLTLDGRNINYSFEDYFNLNLNTRLELKNNNLKGNILINKGEINKILGKNISVVKIIKNFLKDFFQKNKINNTTLKTPVDIDTNNKFSDFNIDVGFRIDKGIKINIEKVTGILTDVKGIILGQGNLKGNLGKINFLGETDIKDGEFVANGNKFNIDRAIIIFNDSNEYIPYLNPNINFSTNTIVENRNVEFSLDGPIKDLTLIVKSGNNVSVNSLDSILNDQGIKSDGDTNFSFFLANLIGGQVTDIILNPVVNILHKMGFKGFKLKSSIIAEEKSGNEHRDSSMAFSAYIEAESPLYKDKIFWKAKANFMDKAKDYSNGNSIENYGAADYDINIYHKINKKFSWGVGAQKLKEELEKQGNKDVNYYIELKFEKRFNFRNGGLE